MEPRNATSIFWYGILSAVVAALLIWIGVTIGKGYHTPVPATPITARIPQSMPQPVTSVHPPPGTTQEKLPKQPKPPKADSFRQIPPDPGSKLITGFTGTNSQTTEKFVVTKPPWRIKWYTRPTNQQRSNFIVYLCDSEDKTVGLAANAVGEAKDEVVVRQYGVFYLKIVTDQYYEIECTEAQ